MSGRMEDVFAVPNEKAYEEVDEELEPRIITMTGAPNRQNH